MASSSSSSSPSSFSFSSSSAAAAVSSSAPSAMSQPLHNFTLPLWNRSGSPSGSNKRSRSMKSPPRRPNAASPTPPRHSPLRDSAARPPPPQPPRFQRSIRDSSMPPPPPRSESWRREASLPPPQHFRHAGRDSAMPPHRFESWRRESSPPLPPPPRFSGMRPPRFESWRRESSPTPPPTRFQMPPPSRFDSWRRESSPSPYRFQPWRRESSPPPSRFRSPIRDFPPPPSRSRSQYRDFSEPRSRFPREFPSSPPRRFQPLIREPAAAQPPRFQNRDTVGDSRAATPQAQPPSRANPPREPSAIDEEEFERLAFVREESLRNYRGRDWWSESSEDRRSPVIAYSRNPNKKTGFSAPLVHATKNIGASSSNSADAAPQIPEATSEFPETEIQTSSRVDDENPKSQVLKNEAAASSSSSLKLQQGTAADTTDEAGAKKSGYKIKIGSKKGNKEEESPCKKEEKEEVVKTWNLRPRNTLRRKPEKPLLRSSAPKPAAAEKAKKKLSVQVSLTAAEIEEDIFALTGAKPSRRPNRKHPKTVQKQVDVLSPGLSLVSITAETYK